MLRGTGKFVDGRPTRGLGGRRSLSRGPTRLIRKPRVGTSTAMEIGLERVPSLTSTLERLRSTRVGLLAHSASVDRSLVHIADLFAAWGVAPRLFFGPEHGYGGEAQD